jgi:hypothetical protein
MKNENIRVMVLILLTLFMCTSSCSKNPSDGSGTKKVVKITGTNGNTVTIKSNQCFKVTGNPPTIRVLPLDPQVVDAVFSNYDVFIEKAERELGSKASSYHRSLYESMQRGNLERVAQKILYYEFFGEILHL